MERMDKANIPVLVRRPAPKPTESLAGYLLRLSQVNGYESYRYVLKRGGIEGRVTNPRTIDLEVLGRLTNRRASELKRISYFDRQGGGSGGLWQVLGHPIREQELDFAHTKICPLCIAEKGIIEAYFDLKIVCGCPVHRVELLDQCPTCHEPLSWFRPGLLECGCGASLLQKTLPSISAVECDLLNCIRAKALGEKHIAFPQGSLLPKPIHNLKLRSMIQLVWTLYSQSIETKFKRKGAARNAVTFAANLLADWPRNLFQMLDVLMEKRDPDTNPCLSWGPLRGIYRDLFNRGKVFETKSEEAFVREAFERYVTERPEYCRLAGNPAFKHEEHKGRYITRAGMCRRLGISTGFAKRLIAEGKVTLAQVSTRSGRIVIDTQRSEVMQLSKGALHSSSSCAMLIGIPNLVLAELGRAGDFEPYHLVKPVELYYEADIQEFLAKFLSLVPMEKTGSQAPGAIVSLGDLMLSKVGTIKMKAAIIRAVLAAEIQVLGSKDGTLRGLQLNSEQCKRYTHYWTPQKTVSNTKTEAARLLSCDTSVISELVKRGLLKGHHDGHQKSSTFRITFDSIEEFHRRFTFLRELGINYGIPGKSLAPRCNANGIDLFYVRADDGRRQAFISSSDRERILAAFGVALPSLSSGM